MSREEKGLEGKSRLEIGRNSFSERVVRCWNEQPREAVESPSMQVFRSTQCSALDDKVGMAHRLDLMILEVISNLNGAVII